jgi:protein-tyrosine phosphatase
VNQEQKSNNNRILTYTSFQDDLSWLTEHLAVSGCFAAVDVAGLADEHLIRAVIDLRDEDCDEPAILARHRIALLHLPTPDMSAATQAMLDRGVAFAREHLNRGSRILIHCQHGVGRSPLLALCVMVDCGMQPLEALTQAKNRRVRVSPSEAQYRGWAEWLERNGHRAPDYHSFGCIAYRHLAPS